MTDIISSILEAEKKADEIIKSASEKSKKVRAEGDAQAEKIMNTAIYVFKVSRAKKIQDAEKDADKRYAEIINKENCKTEFFIESAEKAAEAVSENLVKKVLL